MGRGRSAPGKPPPKHPVSKTVTSGPLAKAVKNYENKFTKEPSMSRDISFYSSPILFS